MDDPRMEAYLRTFQPLPAAPLPASVEPVRQLRRWGFVALSAAAAAVITVLLLIPRFRTVPPVVVGTQPMTIGSANQILSGSPSWKSTIDDAGFAFHSSSATPLPGRRSVIAFLGQEDLSE
jgi:hypothetical protein